VPNSTAFAVYFSRLWMLPIPKLRLPSALPSVLLNSRSRLHWRNAQRKATQNTAAKKAGRTQVAGSDDFSANSSIFVQQLAQNSSSVC
jgi:hypothetical protein